jgi:hypothetical protein
VPLAATKRSLHGHTDTVRSAASAMATRDIELSEISDKSSLTANDKISNVDKLVVAVVIIGIIVFTSFQISESVAAHENPATKSTVEVLPRKYPGLMICPFSRDVGANYGVCPKWSPDALLQYEPGGNGLINANLHSASQRTQTRCPDNHFATLGPANGNGLIFGKFVFGSISKQIESIKTFAQKVTIKNSAKPTLKCETPRGSSECKNPQDAVTFPYLCPSFTPPNVQCTVYDPNYFDTQAKVTGMDPICNPMKEAFGNALDSLSFSLQFDLDPQDAAKNEPAGYKYSGLIPQPNIPKFGRTVFKSLPTQLFANPSELNSQFGQSNNANFSLFAGVVAVLYDPSMGVPTTLNFDNARDSSMSEDILGSSVLLHTDCGYYPGVPNPNGKCPQVKFPPIDILISSQVDWKFSKKIPQRLFNTTTYSTTTQPSTKKSYCSPWSGPTCDSDVRMAFTSSSTVVTTQIISLTILTTISIIVSTAATLWGSQDKIKAGIALAKEKLDAYKKGK